MGAEFVKVMTPVAVEHARTLDSVQCGKVIVSGLGTRATVARLATPDPVNMTGSGVAVAPVYAIVTGVL